MVYQWALLTFGATLMTEMIMNIREPDCGFLPHLRSLEARQRRLWPKRRLVIRIRKMFSSNSSNFYAKNNWIGLCAFQVHHLCGCLTRLLYGHPFKRQQKHLRALGLTAALSSAQFPLPGYSTNLSLLDARNDCLLIVSLKMYNTSWLTIPPQAHSQNFRTALSPNLFFTYIIDLADRLTMLYTSSFAAILILTECVKHIKC